MSGNAAERATVRRAGIDDAASLARLRWMWRTAERGEHGLPHAEFATAFRAWWEEHLRSHVAFVAELDGHALGMAWLAIFDRIPNPDGIERLAGNLQSVYVVPESRDHGIGARLVDAVIAEAKTRGLGYLIVHPSIRAYALYERLGFGRTDELLYLRLGSTTAHRAE